jgi:hypothetical protein
MISIYPNKHASFESKYALSDAIANLSAKVKNDDRRSRGQGGILGSVKPERVILRYWNLWMDYSGWIQFEGSFKEKKGGTVLEGSFCITKGSRVFMNSWLAINIFLFSYSLLKLELMVLSVCMFILWLGFLFVIWRGREQNIENISEVVNAALQYG